VWYVKCVAAACLPMVRHVSFNLDENEVQLYEQTLVPTPTIARKKGKGKEKGGSQRAPNKASKHKKLVPQRLDG
jgi:hypothetical protein